MIRIKIALLTFLAFISSALVLRCSAAGVPPVNIETVPVGNPGNAADVYFSSRFGAVPYVFQMGKFEVTNSQYAGFLQAVASSDPYALFDSQMTSSLHGGISRSGSPGSFAYQTKPGMANKPVIFVSFFDAARFANWLHNGQGSADTETGAYTLLGGTPTPSNNRTVARNPGARWFIPSENEWYKAAFYDAGAASYFDYPTSSNADPTADLPPGATNSANFANVVATVTDVGAYPNSPSPYGTFDQAGNVWEWNESVYFFDDRGLRGGSWSQLDGPFELGNASFAGHSDVGAELYGFRIATIVPEPRAVMLCLLAVICGIKRQAKLSPIRNTA